MKKLSQFLTVAIFLAAVLSNSILAQIEKTWQLQKPDNIAISQILKCSNDRFRLSTLNFDNKRTLQQTGDLEFNGEKVSLIFDDEKVGIWKFSAVFYSGDQVMVITFSNGAKYKWAVCGSRYDTYFDDTINS
jgi:hypothetical protein